VYYQTFRKQAAARQQLTKDPVQSSLCFPIGWQFPKAPGDHYPRLFVSSENNLSRYNKRGLSSRFPVLLKAAEAYIGTVSDLHKVVIEPLMQLKSPAS